MRDFTVVGITGPSGSGKSTFVKYLLKLGFVCIDADVLARQVLCTDKECAIALKTAFGDDIILKSGEINRGLLAKRAFNSPSATKRLNDITHPRIFLKVFALIKKYISEGKRLIVFDAPVLFESNGDIICDFTVSVLADRDTRLERIMKRDNISSKLALERFSAQHDDDYYISRSDFVVDGTGSEEYLTETAKIIRDKSIGRAGG